MKKYILLLLISTLIGCATIKPIPYQEKEHIYSVNFDTIWSTSIQMLVQENFPIKSIDKENGLIQTDYNKEYLKDSWIHHARYSLSLMVIPINKEKTKVIINPHYEAYFPSKIGSLQPGEWVAKNDKDKMLINKYFIKLSSLL